MNTTSNSETVKRKLRCKLKALGKTQPFIAGSLVKIQRQCGNPNCRCAQGGPKHPAHLLTTKVKGKTRSIYVPVDQVEEVRQWCEHYRALKAEIKSVCECCEQLIRLHVTEKRAAARARRTSSGA